jgi:hypothetical protein
MATVTFMAVAAAVAGASPQWDRIGPYNIFDSIDPSKGEAGTLAK